MTPRTRIVLIVVVAAVLAAGVAIGATFLQGEGGEGAPAAGERPQGAPPLVLDLGIREDPAAVDLRRAARLYEQGNRDEAARIFARYPASLDAQVGAAMAGWPDGTAPALDELARVHPRSALVRVNRGLARFWSGREEQAVEDWRAARRLEPDSPSAVRADDLLHPNTPRGLPAFVPSFAPPASIAALPPAQQVAALRAAARSGGPREKILYGVALQRLERRVSAERELAAAARLAPRDAEAQVAAAVGRFTKSEPARAFSRLGPLVLRYPKQPTVRFHLGLLLLWMGELDDARRQLRLARAAAPGDPLAREAKRFLDRLEGVRTQ
jgi:predicted Zn-dependent protease